jgi:hypothetical protein
VHRTIRERAPVCDFSNGERTGIDDLAALIARVLKEMCAKTEGAGKAGCQAAPAARAQKSTRGSHHRFDRIDPAFPARMVLTVSFVLSLVIGLFVTIPRAMQKHCREKTSASRGQDHTTSPSAKGAVRLSAPPRPSQPAPTFVTIAKRPSLEARAGRD